MHTTPNFYAAIIQSVTGCPADQTDRVYDMMVNISHNAPFGSMKTREFTALCRKAWATVQYMDTPEGKALVAELNAEMGL